MDVMIVEDERRLGQTLKSSLREYDIRSVLVESCSEADAMLADRTFDAIVLDLNLPDGDGLDLVRAWRARGLSGAVIVVSARGSSDDRIKGLNLGADDYLPKPFSVGELVARLRAVSRRHAPTRTLRLGHGPLSIDLVARVVSVDGKPLDLTGREYELVELFLRNPRRVLTRSQIQESIWRTGSELENNILDVYISRLRQKIEFVSGRPLIRTIRGVGYQLL